jgi:hypothetical protein
MAVDLPFFLSDIENNLLSQEEIQLAFEQLIQCADFVELNLLKGDLKKQDLNLPISNFETANQASLPRARSFSNLPVGWKVKDSHLLKEVFFDLNAPDGEKNALVYNHTSFFVKAIWLNNGLKLEIAHPKIDAHSEELRVLEKHLEVFEKTLRFGI